MNIDVVGRLSAADRGQLPANLQIDKFNLVKCGRLHLTFAHLHKSEAGVCEIFNKSVEPLLDLCITGFNTCLMVVGESDSGKKELLLGDETVRNGILPILFASLFAKIGDDDTYSSYHNKVGRKLDRVQMQMVEIRGDEIIDLLDTSDRGEPLQLTETAASGVRITNLTKKHIPDVDEGSDALKCACHRSRGLSASAIIAYIRLTLLPHEKSQPNHSCFSVVILPGSENLPMDISNIDIKDVAPPMKFIFQLMQHVHELSVRRTPETIVKRPANTDCTLAALLRDELGGNCKTRVFVCLKPYHDPSKIDALFRFITDLSRVKNYPILNDAFALQLISQYRSEIMTLESRNSGEEFSPEVLRLRVENVDLRDAYEGLLPKIDQCRRRIDSLEKDKLDLSDQVLAVEEEKLKLSKMLVEMQIDNNKLKEECEASKFELNNRIMQLENENMEVRMTTENHMRTIETLNMRNVELETELRDVTQEYTILKKNYTSLVKAYEDELAHSDEISTELLNLASTKAELIRNIDILSQQVDARNPEADLKHARVIINRRPPTRIKVSDLPIREQGDRNQCSTTEKRYKAEMDRQRQTYLDNEKVLEAKIDNLRKELDEARDATRAKYTALAELNARVLTLTDQKNTLESQNNRMQHKLKAINEDFRARLVKFVEDAALFIDRQKVGDLEGSRKKMEEYVNEMLGELKHAYHVREEQLSSVAQDCRAQMRVIIRKHEALIAAYRELKLQVVGLGIHDINLGPDETKLMLTETELHSVQQREINRLREDLNQSEMEREELQIQTMSVKKRMTMTSDNNINKSVEATSPQSWAVLQKQLKEFTLNTQQELETERAGLLSRNAMLEQEVTELNDYINTDLNRYKNEIARLQGLLVTPGGKKLCTQP